MKDVRPAHTRTGPFAARPCPVCRGTRFEVLYGQRFETFLAGSITNAYDVVSCGGCGMCFATGLPDQARFDDYYSRSSKYDLTGAGAEASLFDKARFDEEAAFIAANTPDRTGSILDIGTATGGLLVALRDLGFTHLYGVEPSSEAAAKAREAGLDVIIGNASDARAWKTKFSVVALVAVLEHLMDPGPAAASLAELLAPDGLLYFLVPDASRFKDHVGAPFQEFSVEHINYFTSTSLRNLLGAFGLQVVVERSTSVTLSADATGPALEVLCRISGKPHVVQPDPAGAELLSRYIGASAEKETEIASVISDLADKREPLYVWGAGTNALHLLVATKLVDCNIVAFIDSNPHYSGETVAGRPVISPTDLRVLDAPILVASAVSQTEISSAARARFGRDINLITLY